MGEAGIGIIGTLAGTFLGFVLSEFSQWKRKGEIRGAAISELVAEIEDNLESTKTLSRSHIPMLSDVWNAHKGKLIFMPCEVREQLRGVYAEVFRHNTWAGQWRSTTGPESTG